jgi:acetylornithine deacetylase/succinyl-diaminopimelate desuccinylase family protein
MIRKNRLIKLTQDLIRINSENPPGDERALARFVARFLKNIGLRPKTYSFAARRDNVLAVWSAQKADAQGAGLPRQGAGLPRQGAGLPRQGAGKPEPLLITPHLDTVPAGRGWKFSPWGGALRKDKIYGRGATDCKCNVAISLEALRSLKEDGFRPRHDVMFLATADEETGSVQGLIPFLEKDIIRPAYALVLDADAFDIVVAQKGLIHFKVTVDGRRAHGATPEKGVNAIERACELIKVLKATRFVTQKHRFLKPPTINIGTIQGGDKVNMVADQCAFEADLRFLPGMKAFEILTRLRRRFDATRFSYRIEINDIQQPYELDTDHAMVRSLKKAGQSFGGHPAIKGSEGATVITFFKKKRIPAIATGCGVRGMAHATDEYVRVRDLVRGARVLEKFITLFDAR